MGSSPTNICGYVSKCVGQKGLAAMQTTVQPVGVTKEMNLRNPLHTPSGEVQDRSVIGITKMSCVLKQNFKNLNKIGPFPKSPSKFVLRSQV